jgi:hypothetical protein
MSAFLFLSQPPPHGSSPGFNFSAILGAFSPAIAPLARGVIRGLSAITLIMTRSFRQNGHASGPSHQRMSPFRLLAIGVQWVMMTP